MLPQVENLLPRSHDNSESTDYFSLGFTASTSTPTCVSLNSLFSNRTNHQTLDIILILDNPKYMWRQTPWDLTRDSHTQYKNNNTKTWLGFFLLYLRQNIKPYTSNGLGLSWKFLQKNNLYKLQSIESNSRSIEPNRFTQ